MQKRVVSCFSVMPHPGITIKSKKVVVPNQSMTLAEILKRFVRGEKLAVGHETSYADVYDTDLEKISKADLVDRAEFAQKLGSISQLYKLQEQERKIQEEVRKRSAPPATAGGAPPNQQPPAGGDGG